MTAWTVVFLGTEHKTLKQANDAEKHKSKQERSGKKLILPCAGGDSKTGGEPDGSSPRSAG